MKLMMPCRFCGELVPVTGDAEISDDGALVFTSDPAGTRAGWEHQLMHDEQNRSGGIV